MSRARGFKWDNVEKKQYTVAAGGAKSVAGSATAITVSATAPVSPSNGDSWFDSINAALYIYYFDGTSSQWAIAGGSVNLGGTVIDGGGVVLAVPTYSLSTTTASANEGTQFTITLTTTNVVDGTNIPYTITGVSSADISDASLTGVFDVQGNTASTTFTVADDTTTEGEETFTLSLDALSTTQNVTINDTSIVSAAVVDYLVVAGGGAGSQAWGGGGAGGLLTNSNFDLLSSTAYTITVGAGGAGQPSSPVTNSNRGADSSIAGTGITTILAIGGGGGDGYNASSTAATNGGSGGGGAHVGANGGNNGGTFGQYSLQPGGLGTAGQGNNGGDGRSVQNFGGGGGGGAGADGADGTHSHGGVGGVGIQSSITGSAVYYAGGGGGGGYSSIAIGVGGLGGGGDGSRSPQWSVPGDGTANTGGGGGGAYSDVSANNASASGGSGVVIIRTLATASATTGSPTVTTDGSYNIYTYTGSGSITF